MTYHNGDVYTGEFSKNKMHGKGVFEYAAGDVLKSIGEWKDGKKVGFFEDIVRVSKQVYYDYDDDTTSLSRRTKRRKVSTSPS
eukprot:scaffold8993_cov207-Skeletonema_marinoi.AAC.17